MKKRITLLLVAVALCASVPSSFTYNLQAATSPDVNEVKLVLKDTKSEIAAIKADIKILRSNISKANRSLEKARKSEVKQRETCDALEGKISAKKAVYKLAEGRIASGNAAAAKGQAGLAVEIKNLEDEYTQALERWEMDKLVANDSATVIDVNKKLIQLRRERLKELDSRLTGLKSGNIQVESTPATPVAEVQAEAQKAAQAQAEKEAKVAAEAQAEAEKAAKAAAEAQAKKEAEAAAKAAADAQAQVQAEIEKAKKEAENAKVEAQAAGAAAEAQAKAEKKAQAQAEKEAKAAAKAQAKAQKAAQRQEKKAAKEAKKEALKIAEREAESRQQAQKESPILKAAPVPATVPLVLDANSKEAKLQELLELYRQDKISPRQYQERRAAILEGKE